MNTIAPKLDRLESHLPPVTRRWVHLNRVVARAGFGAAGRALGALSSAAGQVSKRASTGVKTVSGQAQSASGRVAATTKSGVKEVAGQARAQAVRTMESAEEATKDLLDDAVEAVEDHPTGAYETWTRAELYERAKELNIDGRSGMAKKQLVSALRAA